MILLPHWVDTETTPRHPVLRRQRREKANDASDAGDRLTWTAQGPRLNHVYALAAEGVVLLHCAWIVFVVTGAFWLRRHPHWRLVHLLTVIYSVTIEIFRWICPLTHLEQALWRRAGEEAYQEAFLTHYLETLIYAPVPQWLLICLTVTLLAVTLVLYSRPLPSRSASGGSSR